MRPAIGVPRFDSGARLDPLTPGADVLTTFLLTLRIAALLTTTDRLQDAPLFASACVRHATPHVSAERLCAVAYVESAYRYAAVNAGGHCGAWQQHPRWSQMWGDDCADGCRQPGGEGVTCEELLDVPTAARVAARHLDYLERHPRPRPALCRYAGASGGRCRDYTNAVARVELRLAGARP
jgi:hypothetical protein